MKKPQTCLVIMASAAVLIALMPLFAPLLNGYVRVAVGGALALIAILTLILMLVLRQNDRAILAQMDAVFDENSSAAAKVIREVSIPCALIDGTGRIVWHNSTFGTLFGGNSILALIPAYQPEAPLAAVPVSVNGGIYQAMSIPLKRPSARRDLTFMYLLDRTEAAHYQRLFEDQLPYVALIYIDNYEELTQNTQFLQSSVLTEVERVVAEAVHAAGGIYRRYDNGRYIAVFEAKSVADMEAQRFPLLEAAQNIETGTNSSVSLSIAVGVADRIIHSDESARQAMELALGRGGDQAVVKVGTNYRFYGGRRQMDTAQSRVKSRLFAKALRQLFENSGDVFVVGHKRPDMDCIGAALGIVTCAKAAGLRAYVVLDESNASIDRVFDMIESNRNYQGVILSSEQAMRQIRPSSVLVIVDTQRPMLVECPELLGTTSRIVIIDHHRRSADRIENITLHHLESRASSASELVCETIQYFDDHLRPPAFVCGALLAGITVDTKHFAFNVGARTFEAAAYLRRNGADIAMVKQLFQDDMESFGDCANTVRSADVLESGIAVAAVETGVKNAALIAAKAADELIGIRGIEAAFVLGREDGKINISGRSLGHINAQLVLEKLGGGGHLTMAGAALTDIDMEEAEMLLRTKIDEYIAEQKQKSNTK